MGMPPTSQFFPDARGFCVATVRNGEDVDELYDLEEDPHELTNRALDDGPRYRAALVEMVARLGDWSMRTEDGAPVPLPPIDANGKISARADGRTDTSVPSHRRPRL